MIVNNVKCGMIVVFACLSVLFTGCVSSHMKQPVAQALELPEQKCLTYEKQPLHILSHRHVDSRSHSDIFEIKFTPHVNVLHKKYDVTITYYRAKGEQPRPLVLCLPIMDGKNVVARIFANYLASKGYHTAIVHKQHEMFHELNADNYQELLNSGLEQIVYNHMLALDWFETQPEIDANRIGVAGISMGSIKALLLTAYDSRIQGVFAALTGGDLPYILSYSDDAGVVRTRNQILASTELSLAELREDLRQRVTHDPMLLAPYIETEQVMLILAALDSTVPYEKGKELRQALRYPETVFVLGNHISSVMFINYILEKCDHFMRRKLNVPNRARRKLYK